MKEIIVHVSSSDIIAASWVIFTGIILGCFIIANEISRLIKLK